MLIVALYKVNGFVIALNVLVSRIKILNSMEDALK